jgi:hypothetical protein
MAFRPQDGWPKSREFVEKALRNAFEIGRQTPQQVPNTAEKNAKFKIYSALVANNLRR